MPVFFKPEHLSHSQIQMYENCPQCYMLNYVMGLWQEEERDAFIFGDLFHKGLASFYRGRDFWDGFKPGLSNLPAKKAFDFEGNALRLWEHFQVFGDKYQPKLIEHKFLVPLQNPLTREILAVPIKGVFDLVTTDMQCIDHKTSSKEYDENESRSSSQLLIYSMSFRRLFGIPPSKLVFSVFRKDSKIGLWQKVEVKPDPIQEAIRFLEIKQVLKGIMAGEFAPKRTGWYFQHHPTCPMYFVPRKKSPLTKKVCELPLN